MASVFEKKIQFPSEVDPNKGGAPYFRILKICQITIIFLFIAFIAVRIKQFQDVFRSMDLFTEEDALRNNIFIYIASIWLAWNCWFWSQVLLSLREHPRFNKNKSNLEQTDDKYYANNHKSWLENLSFKEKLYVWLVENLPRLLGASAIIMVGYAFQIAFGNQKAENTFIVQGIMYFVVYFLTAVLFYLFFVYRSKLSRSWLMQKLGSNILLPAYVRAIETPSEMFKQKASFFVAFGFSVGVWLLTFVFFLINAVKFAPFFNTATIFLLAISGWLALVSFLYHFSRRFSFPFLLLLVGWTILCSLSNDNHELRFLQPEDTNQPIISQHADSVLSDYFINWLKQKNNAPIASQDTFPVILIAVEGGGIRSAYWTASVLSALQQEVPEFVNHVFAISSVSGGSLGASVYVGLLAHSLTYIENIRIDSLSKEMLSQNHLSPLIAKMMYPDMLQKVIPFPIQSFDRAQGLEMSWEEAWNEAFKEGTTNQMQANYGSIWENPDLRYKVPLLFLNTTYVEQGIRGVLAPVSLMENSSAGKMLSMIELREYLYGKIRLSTAAGISARFPYVTPAAKIPISKDKYFHVIDGGYFENLGGGTLLDIHSQLMNIYNSGKYKSYKDSLPAHLQFYAITITNYFFLDSIQNVEPLTTLHDLKTPISGILNARGARTPYVLSNIENTNGIHKVIHFNLERRDSLNIENIGVPLGWQMSKISIREMDRQLKARSTRQAINEVNIILSKSRDDSAF